MNLSFREIFTDSEFNHLAIFSIFFCFVGVFLVVLVFSLFCGYFLCFTGIVFVLPAFYLFYRGKNNIDKKNHIETFLRHYSNIFSIILCSAGMFFVLSVFSSFCRYFAYFAEVKTTLSINK